MTTFEEAVAYLNEKQIEFRQGDEYVGEPGVDRHKEDRPWIESIEIPFSPQEWLDIISSDSEILGSCCATISNARDILYAQARHGRWIDAKDLWEFVEILSHHDGFEYMLPQTHENYEEWSCWYDKTAKPTDDPIYRLWEVYDKTKDHLKLKVPHDKPYPEDSKVREPVHAAISTLYDGVHNLFWSTSCFSEGRENDPQWMVDQKRARRQLTIARLLQDLLTHIDTLDLGDFDGFAICKRDELDDICRNMLGKCIFTTEAEAQGMIERWSKSWDETEERNENWECPRDTMVVRPVRVSSKTGLTFLDTEGSTPG